jgi:DNA-directed RNA polymerase subunit H (RpoH/RPB5)
LHNESEEANIKCKNKKYFYRLINNDEKKCILKIYEGKRENGPDVSEKEPFLHAVAGIEDDWRQKNVEKYLGVKCSLLINLRK